MKYVPIAERFPKFVNRTEGCWLWTGGKDHGGYGHIHTEGDKHESAHRVAWKLANGPIPAGLFVLHTCDTPACVRPDHLFLGTNADNLADMARKRRSQIGERHHNAKLTEDGVRLIRTSSRPASELAGELGVTVSAVQSVRRGVGWKYVTTQPDGAA